jgi:hypothetical protein
MGLKNGPVYQQFCKPIQDDVWILPHVFKSSGVDWDPKHFDIYLQHLHDIHNSVSEIVDCDNHISTCGEYYFGIFAAFDKYGERKHRATRMTCKNPTVDHRSIIRFAVCQDT